ncbi:hypothetical protein CYK24_03185 [Trueperella bernardiae]|uniref:hypothetical protein n=1 Tax=Trueperella bernardiae TaxID=59561 RepID=UPI000C7C6D18|nr:hypothetical protein [Trueperella bernardiae]PKZ89312.1 hypothetical protein CYK24_03185 [Trueperella bernardiae]
MMHTTLGTWAALFGFNIDDLSLDPHGELKLTRGQRQDMNRDARDAYMDFVENLLQAAYPGAGIIIDRADGDILASTDADIDIFSPEWEELAYEVKIGPDLDDLLDEYTALADANEDADEDEEAEGEEPWEKIAPTIQRQYASLIPDHAYIYLASLHPEDALHKSGEISDRFNSQDVRLAFIAKTGYGLFLRALTDTRAAEGEKTERKALAAVFLEAHAQAAEKYAADREDIHTGRVMTGTVFRGLAHGLGYSDERLAEALGVRNARTIRHWKAGKRPIPAGVAEEMWAIWDDFLDAAREAIGECDSPFVPVNGESPASLVAAVAILHGRVAESPARPRQPWIE